jgi:hypothetical protein
MDNIKMNKICEENIHEEEYPIRNSSDEGKCKLKLSAALSLCYSAIQ